MLVFAGHHPSKQGAINCKTTEMIECINLCQSIVTSIVTIGGIGTNKQKQQEILTTADSVNIEIHFCTSSETNAGATVLYKPNCDKSYEIACIMQKHLNREIGCINFPLEGYYRADKKMGIDYFMLNPFPSVVVNIEKWENLEVYKNNKENYLRGLKNGLNELYAKE